MGVQGMRMHGYSSQTVLLCSFVRSVEGQFASDKREDLSLLKSMYMLLGVSPVFACTQNCFLPQPCVTTSQVDDQKPCEPAQVRARLE